MAGLARTNAVTAWLEAQARDLFELSTAERADHLAFVAHVIENGVTLKALAAKIESELLFEVSASTLRRHLARKHGEAETDAALDAARARASHTLADESLEIVDAPAYTPQEVSRAASRARSRQWLAERYNPAKYGAAKAPTLSISIGSLHIDALRQTPPRPVITAEATVQLGDGVTAEPVAT